MLKPDFFIVGAPKCGTTAMYTYLQAHPDIFMSEVKEPYYFCSDLGFHRFRNEQEYLKLFSVASPQQRIGEASTWYLYSSQAAAAIHAFNTDARIIVMLRNPVDMMYSLYSHFLYIGSEETDSFEAALAAEEERKHGNCIPEGVEQYKVLLYREVASFSGQVERYLKIFGQDRVHVIIFDDMVHAPDKTYRQTLRFLEVNPGFQPPFPAVNVSKQVKSRSFRHMIQSPPAWISRLSHLFLSQSQRDHLVKLLWKLNARRWQRPPLGPELRSQLQAEMAPDVERLERMLQIDLSYWK